MNLLVLTLGLILGSLSGSAPCLDCAYEYGALQAAQNAYDQAVIDEQSAAIEFVLDPTPFNYGVWLGAQADLASAESVLNDAQQAYDDCIGVVDPIPEPTSYELLSSTVSILE